MGVTITLDVLQGARDFQPGIFAHILIQIQLLVQLLVEMGRTILLFRLHIQSNAMMEML
mgnify:CR=1 FL=1